ncbi:diguanylate cyclase domain-containing protein [Nodosilinea nodulosa]|uniref:diguanylate cyclase domain-containing protein n=1 Tax=Nodosilinea nodulosa TaxID=416001 RepID=UPI0003168E22|nr:diguanylate cyclase [Nodosilinea nodulosa]
MTRPPRPPSDASADAPKSTSENTSRHQVDQENQRLHQEIQRLRQENADLRIALATTAEHGDFIEADLHHTNQRLQAEMVERLRAEATLKTLIDLISRQKSDLEIIMHTIMEHGDTLDTQWHQKFCAAMVRADIDGLTQIPNRRRFDEYLIQQWEAMEREQSPLAVILCDLDAFKLYNDTYGHLAGDTCLAQVATVLRHSLHHPNDLVARYGGEEFVAVLPRTTLAEAQTVAQRIQREVLGLRIPHQSSTVASVVTLSIGVAGTIPRPQIGVADLVQRADEQLYQAKRLGKNQIFAVDF